jgi:hypothetical protein
MSDRQYKDVSGNPCKLLWLVKNEPEWAESQIRNRDKIERELQEAQARIRLLIAERDSARAIADLNWKLRDEFTALLGTDDVKEAVRRIQEANKRIKLLEEAGNRMYVLLDPASICMRTTEMDNALQGWDDAKISTTQTK